jgi:DNA ligase 1
MIEMNHRLKELIVREERNRVVVLPRVVVEVWYKEIQKSRKYKCGRTLSFARINHIRDDKSTEDADTIEKVSEIYEGVVRQKKANIKHINAHLLLGGNRDGYSG